MAHLVSGWVQKAKSADQSRCPARHSEHTGTDRHKQDNANSLILRSPCYIFCQSGSTLRSLLGTHSRGIALAWYPAVPPHLPRLCDPVSWLSPGPQTLAHTVATLNRGQKGEQSESSLLSRFLCNPAEEPHTCPGAHHFPGWLPGPGLLTLFPEYSPIFSVRFPLLIRKAGGHLCFPKLSSKQDALNTCAGK